MFKRLSGIMALLLTSILITSSHFTPSEYRARQPGATASAQIKVHRDPITGANVPNEQSSSKNVRAANTSTATTADNHQSRTFEEKPSHVPGGGMMIELKGEFNSHMVVQRHTNAPADHELSTHCNHSDVQAESS